MKRKQIFFSLLLIVSTWLNATTVSAQVKLPPQASGNIKIAPQAADHSAIFAGLKKDDGLFAAFVTKMNGGHKDTSDALEAQSVYFYDRLTEQADDQLAGVVKKAAEAGKKKYEQLKAKKGAVKNGPVKPGPARKAANYPDTETQPFRKAAFLADEDGGIVKTETDNGINIRGSEVKTIETRDGTAIRTSSGNSDLKFDGKRMSSETTMNDKVEAVSKTTGHKITKTMKLEWGAALDVCPDAEGVIRGTGKVRLYLQNMVNTGRDIGALTAETTLEVKITGYVNDAAELTHWDLEGTLTETTIGYDRALDHGIFDTVNGITDGKGTFTIKISNSTPPTSIEEEGTRWRKDVSAKFGEMEVRTLDDLDQGRIDRMSNSTHSTLDGVMMQLDPLMRSSISHWRGGECVDVECVSAKAALKAGEATDITATAVSKQDLSKISAGHKAGGSLSVTPAEQRAGPSAVYTLTAPKAGETAQFVVTATSRRGIGIGLWEYQIPRPKKPPVKNPPPPRPKPDPIWSGSIKAVHTEKETREAQPSGRMAGETITKNKRWEVTLEVPGTRDLSGGIVNNFHAQTAVIYHGSDYRETRYAPGKMSCGNGPIFISPETRKFEIIEKGDGRQLLLVTISVIGTRGYISFGSPEVQGERTVISKYETNCAAYNAANSSTHTDPRGVSIGSPSFEVEFQIDPSSPDQITGTKTVVNFDGSETVYTWSLTRGK